MIHILEILGIVIGSIVALGLLAFVALWIGSALYATRLIRRNKQDVATYLRTEFPNDRSEWRTGMDEWRTAMKRWEDK